MESEMVHWPSGMPWYGFSPVIGDHDVDALFHWLSGMPWYGWVAVVAIVCGCISSIIKMRYQHIERIERIRHGLEPEGGKPAAPPEV